MKKTRIELTDTMLSALVKMSDGNPGAATALAEMVKQGPMIDPDAAGGGLGAVLLLDTLGIYGTDIYILWSDICNRSSVKTLALLRAYQFGYLEGNVLKDACHRQDRSGSELIPVNELYLKVKQRLPNFDKEEEVVKID